MPEDAERLFKFAEAEVWRRGDRYFVRYDAGGHLAVMREDEVSKAEAEKAARGRDELTSLLWAIQGRLTASGEDPYRSNLPSG
ncbi:hypothetical protein QO010_003672 [Caulobacter ginsengisoli]|uniref:Uncharacterized protein n=1 Tax=Caulobacter ginsengisoli TaxID=400775 RepID=A0ABU0IV34_9CAUL|nr:hypothetical protein [Caulobacter ginsengisoli]MDQ0465880.1 hypothetical protein [Caulobacter ginsengisoli]